MIYAVDFDGTIVLGDSYPDPNKGTPNWPLINKIKKLQMQGNEIVLWTCRSEHYLVDALQFCENELKLTFTRVNESSPERIAKHDNLNPRKIGADYYIDDKALSISEFLALDI